jgi:formylglycine-generating enzyme required for sulfatase activity
VEKLFTALDTDYEWLKTHRRLQVKALEWERSNKDNGFLLHGRDLDEAEQQISINATKNPNPTDLQREYVLKSRQASTRQRRITTGILITLVAVMTGIIVALAYPYVAEWNAKRLAQSEMILIPAGITTFGVTNNDSKVGVAVPLQQIRLAAFKIDKYEVTNKQYKLCVDYGDCTIPLEQADFNDPEKRNHPVVYVTLFQANNYCKWMGLRLPSEVEWERAARGAKGALWPWGNENPSTNRVNMPEPGTTNTTDGTQVVNSNIYGVSPEGIYNLVGNVWEWTSSYLYSGGNYDIAAHWDGTLKGFKGTQFYATRGGGWANQINYVSQNNPNKGTDARKDLGFRCAIDFKQ